MKKERKSIRDLIEYFKRRPHKDLSHGPVVDSVEEQYVKLYRKKPRDTWRSIRRLYQEGMLVKVKKGIYRYDPNYAKKKTLLDFTPEAKEEIFRRDDYKCVVCRRGKKEGMEIHADHIISLDKGGTNTVDNGQTLCSEHNLLKKNYSQTEFGKRLVKRLYEEAVKISDERMIKFCRDIFDVYDGHRINGHIKRPNKE